MSKLALLAVAAAVIAGVVHGLLGSAWNIAIDDETSPLYPKGWAYDTAEVGHTTTTATDETW